MFGLSHKRCMTAQSKLLWAMGLGLSAAAAAPAYATPASSQSATALPRFSLNSVIPTRQTTLAGEMTETTPWAHYYAVEGIAPAGAISFSLQATGNTISGWYGNVYLADSCTTLSGGATICGANTRLGSMVSGLGGTALTLPVQPGFVNFTPPQYFLIETGGTGNSPVEEYNVIVSTQVPAPAALGLLGIGLLGMGLTRRRNGSTTTPSV